jgi:hypothetical protein
MRLTYAGIIGCTLSEQFFQSLSFAVEEYSWKKIYFSETSSANHNYTGKAEVVNNLNSIIDDKDITVVFVSNAHLHVVPQLLQAGKCVRTV